MTASHRRPVVAALASLTLLVAACGSDDDSSGSDAAPSATDEPSDAASTDEASDAASSDQPAQADDAERPTIVVTTNILGDVVGEVVGDGAEVVTIMPVRADPHDFQASAQEVDEMMNADALIVNGAGLEEGLLDVIESAEAAGVPTFEAISAVETIDFGEDGHDHADEEHSDEEHSDEDHDEEHSDEEHSDEEHSDEDHDEEHSDEDHDEEHSDEEQAHDHSGVDPHFWLDPMRMAVAVDGMVDFIQSEIAFAEPPALEASAADYVAEVEALDAESVAQFETIPEENRVLVTNHESLGYFADHYGFEIAGAIIPGGSTTAGASASDLTELAEVIEEEDVPAIFADTSSSDELAQTLADEVGEVEVIELYTGSLGEPGSDGETYLLMISTNAERVTAGLT